MGVGPDEEGAVARLAFTLNGALIAHLRSAHGSSGHGVPLPAIANMPGQGRDSPLSLRREGRAGSREGTVVASRPLACLTLLDIAKLLVSFAVKRCSVFGKNWRLLLVRRAL